MNPKPIVFVATAIAFACLNLLVFVESSTIKTLDELPYDANNHLSSHVLAYPSSCIATIRAATGIYDGIFLHQFYELKDDAASSVFGHLSNVGCNVACLEKGTPKAVVARPMPHKYWMDGIVDNNGDGKEIERMGLEEFVSSEGCGQVEYIFVNFLDRPAHVYWIDENNEKVQALLLEPDTDEQTSTYIGHEFEVYDDMPHDDKLENKILYKFTVENNGVTSLGHKPHGQISQKNINSQVLEEMEEEWQNQKRVKRTFSPLGFDKGRLPDDVYASIASYYYNNRDPPHLVLETWDADEGITVNFWESVVEFVHMPANLGARWQSRLRELVEIWVGHELETTDIYGMRVYTKGARLLTHVDRVTTHAASLIVNIAQENVGRPWTIEVYDHAHRLHEVVMEPGDVVYYESASSLHGRNTPLQGGKYINLFSHYRPTNDPLWYLKNNPAGTPEPLIDVGDCKLVGKTDEYSQGAVECDNSAIGIHLSPTMFRAQSGDDLYRWWQMTSPTNFDLKEEEKRRIPSQHEL